MISATRTILAPAVTVVPQAHDDSTRIIVPIIVFGGGNEENERPEALVDVERVKKAVENMAKPSREVLVFKAGHHALDEHPQVMSILIVPPRRFKWSSTFRSRPSNRWDTFCILSVHV